MKNNLKSRKYKLSALVALCLVAVLCLSSCTGGKKASDASGTCSDDVKWEYDASDKTLEIKGDGVIPAYKTSSEVPWAAAFESIEKIEIDEGITAIGSYAFYGCSNLESAELPNTITTIGAFAFAYCSSLEEIDLPDTLESVGDSAFEACTSLADVKLGEAVSSLGKRAFAFCSSLESVHILGAADVKEETFYNCNALEIAVFNSGITEDKVAADAFKNTKFNYSKVQIAADPNTTVTVTIEYVYEDGTKAADSVVFEELKVGDSYTKNSPELEGYTADKLTVSGNAPTKDTVITVTYKSVEVSTEETTEPETEEPVEKPSKGSSIFFLVIMVVIIAGIGVAAYLLMRSNKQNEEKARNQNKAKNRKQK